MCNCEKTLPPIEDGIFDENTNLIGGRCEQCNYYHFPVRKYCPSCSSSKIEKCLLSTEGELYSYTIIRSANPWWKDKVPYTIGIVKLPEGISVETQIRNDESAPLQIGSKMKIESAKYINEQNEEVKIYRFYPINGGEINA